MNTYVRIDTPGAQDSAPADHGTAGRFCTVNPWYVARTKMHQEMAVVSDLEREGYCAYFPSVKVLDGKAIGGEKHCETFEPMFPRYIFFSHPVAPHSISAIRYAKGISTILRLGSHLAELEREAIHSIRDLEQRQHISGFEKKDKSPSLCLSTKSDYTQITANDILSAASSDRVMALLLLLSNKNKERLVSAKLMINI